MSPIPLASLEEIAPYQASKWLTVALLCDADEFHDLLETLNQGTIVSIAGLSEEGNEIVSKKQLLKDYAHYIECLKKGVFPNRSIIHPAFTKALSNDLNHFRKIRTGNLNLVRIVKPVLQMQPYWFLYSNTDGKFHSMTLSAESISWGIQFSYPQLFQDPFTKEVHKVLKEEGFPNGELYNRLKLWIRNKSIATPFIIGGQKTHVPMRIGKNCFSWINNHPGLIKKGIKVA